MSIPGCAAYACANSWGSRFVAARRVSGRQGWLGWQKSLYKRERMSGPSTALYSSTPLWRRNRARATPLSGEMTYDVDDLAGRRDCSKLLIQIVHWQRGEFEYPRILSCFRLVRRFAPLVNQIQERGRGARVAKRTVVIL